MESNVGLPCDEEIREEHGKILRERDEMEVNVMAAIDEVYNNRILELQEKCEQKTGHTWYEINFGFSRKCNSCWKTE